MARKAPHDRNNIAVLSDRVCFVRLSASDQLKGTPADQSLPDVLPLLVKSEKQTRGGSIQKY